MTDTANDLRSALDRYRLNVPEESHIQLCRYCELLWDWNSKINLTRHVDMDAFVSRDLMDTLKLSAYIDAGAKILDVGSGGGVPGIPLAIMRPSLKVSLAESVGKKARVLDSIVRRLGMKTTVHARRGEVVLAKEKFDVVTVRAVASLRKLLFWFQKVPQSFDQMLLIKGPRWIEEQKEATEEGLMQNVSLTKLASYKSPGHDGESVVLSLRFPGPDEVEAASSTEA